ncbi:questin oxidase family protein [Actinomadura roseirufa]|uniref:questin oxidase family protein n=1 Tax=Actinomadura roseirufa TaxID=2094049 RepID=UPI00104126D2|nr:questin oxidase family protein [Actinomadura roseirufa]
MTAAAREAGRYADCVDDALDRLWEVGFEFGPDFAVHAPMVAETMATLGLHDDVPRWIEVNRKQRGHHVPPAAGEPLPDDPARARLAALGDYRRVADWVGYFERRLAERPWREVLVEWWPVLMEGALSAFTHGLIRTAHAVRALRTVPEPSALQLNELARGLAYWAGRYTVLPRRLRAEGPRVESAADIPAALSELTALHAGRYAETAPYPPIPLVHTVTAPAALRLVLPVLPAELQLSSYAAVVTVAEAVWKAFPVTPGTGPAAAEGYLPPAGELLVARSVELGEEHAIKLTEACLREDALRPDDRYRAAAHTLIANFTV